jgi:imidazolonepropionase-like amidohydrolase
MSVTKPAVDIRREGSNGAPDTRGRPTKMVDRRTFVRNGLIAASALALPAAEHTTTASRTLFGRRLTHSPRTRRHALRGATLVDVRAEKSIHDAVVVVDGERITHVFSSADGQVPADAELVDLRGKWLVPGLLDMHVHGTTRSDVPLELYVAMGVTGIRDLGGNLTALRLLRKELADSAQLGPRLFFAGPMLDGDPPDAPRLAIIADTPIRAASAVEFLLDQGVDTIKVYNGLSGEALEAAARAAHRRGIPVVGHVPRALTVEQAIDFGLDEIEHSALRAADLVAWKKLDEQEATRLASLRSVTQREALVWQRVDPEWEQVTSLVDRLAKSHVGLCPTLIVDEFDSRFLYSAEANHPANRFLPRSFVEESLGPEHDMFRTPPELKSVVVSGIQKRRRFVAACARAGVRIVAGTDGPGIGRLVPGFGLHHELEILVECGLRPIHALRTATIDAARAMRKERDLGSIEPGKLADLIVLDGDPLADIRNTTRIHAVSLGGELLERDAIREIFTQAEARARSPRNTR